MGQSQYLYLGSSGKTWNSGERKPQLLCEVVCVLCIVTNLKIGRSHTYNTPTTSIFYKLTLLYIASEVGLPQLSVVCSALVH